MSRSINELCDFASSQCPPAHMENSRSIPRLRIAMRNAVAERHGTAAWADQDCLIVYGCVCGSYESHPTPRILPTPAKPSAYTPATLLPQPYP